MIKDINVSVSPVDVIALLRKSAATDFLQKVRDKRASECFPGGCSTEVNEAGELMEVNQLLREILYFLLHYIYLTDIVHSSPVDSVKYKIRIVY